MTGGLSTRLPAHLFFAPPEARRRGARQRPTFLFETVLYHYRLCHPVDIRDAIVEIAAVFVRIEFGRLRQDIEDPITYHRA